MLLPTTIKQLFYPQSQRPLQSYLNLWGIEDNILIGVDLQMSTVFELTGKNLLHLNENELENFYREVNNFLHSLPENATLTFVIQSRLNDEKLINQYLQNIRHARLDEISNTADRPNLDKFIIAEKTKGFKESVPNRQRHLMYITTYASDKDILKPSIFKVIKPNYTKLTKNIHVERTKKLTQITETLISQLNSIGIQINQLTNHQLTDLLYNHLNPGRSELLDIANINPETPLRSQITYNALENEFSHTFIDGYYYRAVNMYTRPETISYLNPIQLLHKIPGEYDFVLNINSLEQKSLEKQLQAIATQSTIISTINPFKKYYEAEIKSRDSADLLEQTKETFQKLYKISLSIILRDTTLESLTARTNQTVSDFRTLGNAECIIDDMNHFYLYLSALPNHSHFNLRHHIFHTDAVSRLLPLHQPWKGTKQPKMLFLTDDNQILPLDLFDDSLPAKHGVILGSTGSGKSFTTNFLLTNFHIESEKNQIVIIDIGGSYRKLCQIFNGEYLEIELSEKYAFNPFPTKKIAFSNNETEINPDIVNYLKLIIQKLLKKDSFTGEESTIILKAIENTYRNCPTDTPLLSDLLANLKGTGEIAEQFAKNLEYWTTGIYGKMLNQQGTISPKSRIVVFDLQKLQEHKELLPIIFFMIQNVIWAKLYNKELKKSLSLTNAGNSLMTAYQPN